MFWQTEQILKARKEREIDSISTKATQADIDAIDLSSYVTGTGITSIVKLTQAEYDLLIPVETTLYIIVG